MNGRNALHLAAMINENADVIRYLLKIGMDVNGTDPVGDTPLHLAAKSNSSSEVIQALLEGGANPNPRNRSGKTPLHLAAAETANPEVVTVLLNSGVNGRLKDNNGNTAFSYARDNENLKGTEAYKALNAASGAGNEEFMELCGKGTPDEVQAAIAAGEKVNSRNAEGLSPLHYAAGWNPIAEVTIALLKAGAKVGARDERGSTPMHLAAMFNPNPEVIMALLKAGADGKAKDKKGMKPLDYAQGNEKLKDTEAYWALNDASF